MRRSESVKIPASVDNLLTWLCPESYYMIQNHSISRNYYLFLMAFLGLLSAFGPFITDMYLPTLPAMADIFQTTASKVQVGLTTSLIGLALGQIIFGPLSDKYGRKPIIVGSLLLFSISTVGSVYSQSIDFFNICRFFQGLGGAGGVVISRSVATDCYSGRELAKTMAIIAGINSVAPVIAPVTGGLVAAAVGWQGIFWTLFGIGVVLLIMTCPFEESLTAENRQTVKLIKLFNSFPALMKKKEFVRLVIVFVFIYGVLFAYISSSSFIIQDYYGLSELWFSLIFAINAVAMGTGSAAVLKFRNLSVASSAGCIGVLLVSVFQLIFYFLFDSILIYEGLTFLMAILLGILFTSVSTRAMESGRAYIGSASAILGASGFMFGGIVSPLVGIGNIMVTTFIIMLLCSLLACILSFLDPKVLTGGMGRRALKV